MMRCLHSHWHRVGASFISQRKAWVLPSISYAHRQFSSKPRSFIDKAAAEGVQSLVGEFYASTEGCFDQCMRALEIESVNEEAGLVVCSLVVGKELENSFRSLHGGAISTLVDIGGTLAILSKDSTKPGVSVELNVSFCSAAPAGSKVKVEGRLLKLGRTLAFTEVVLYDSQTSKIIATGRHTKFV